MKLLFTTVLLSLSFFGSAQQYPIVNWATTPIIPVSIICTANQYKLAGKVRQVTEVWDDNTETRKYNNDGVLLKTISKIYGKDLEYLYKHSPSTRTLQVVVSDKKVFRYSTDVKFNTNGQAIESIEYENPTTYTYNKNQLIQKKVLSSYDKTVDLTKYFYDDGGKLIREENYFNEKPTYQIIYQYQPAKTGTLVTYEYVDKYFNEKNYYTENYNPAGQLEKQVRKSKDSEETETYKLDAVGNWISKTRVIKNLKANTSKTIIHTRKIIYY